MHEIAQTQGETGKGRELAAPAGLACVITQDDSGAISSAKHRTSYAALNALEFDFGKDIGFSQAAERLRGIGYDLERVRAEEIRAHKGWHLPDALIKKGIVGSEEEYGRLWDDCRFSTNELRILEEMLQGGEKIMPVFNPGSLSREELVQILIREVRIPCGTECYGAQNFDKLRKISPWAIPKQKELLQMDWMQKLRAFREAYFTAPDPVPEKPSIHFTVDSLIPTVCERSPIELIGDIRNGKSFMDPSSDILRWRRQYDRCQKGGYPDRTVETIYPLHVFDIGRIATMNCYEHDLLFLLGDCLPDDRWKTLGARPVIASAE